MKNHLKSIAAPRTWKLDRKKCKFIMRPNPGAHKFELGMPLGVILRDHLKLASTMSEVEKMLNNNDILVDGKRKRDRREIVGLFDIINVSSLNKYFQVEIDNKGRLILTEINEKNANVKICKVTGKKALKGAKVQLNLYDGKNVLTVKDVKVGDSVIFNVEKRQIEKVLPLKEGAEILLTKGKHAGSSGKLESLQGETAIYVNDKGNKIETTRKYLYVRK
jgi:small subunit ribosomal protein S4e